MGAAHAPRAAVLVGASLVVAACGSSVSGDLAARHGAPNPLTTTTATTTTTTVATATPATTATTATANGPGATTRLFGWPGVTVTIDHAVAVSYDVRAPLYGQPGERGVAPVSIEPVGHDTTVERFGAAPLDVVIAEPSGQVVGGSIVHGLGAGTPHSVVAPHQPYLDVPAVFESIAFPAAGGGAPRPLGAGTYALFLVLSRTATTARVAAIDRSLQVLAG